MELSEEEKKAIEELEDFIEDDEIQNISVFTAKKIKNIIAKQQNEIKHQRQQRKYWRDNFYEQQKEIEELKSKYKDLFFQNFDLWEKNIFPMKAIREEYISKDKIREKIKELEKCKEEELKNDDDFGTHTLKWAIADYVISALKELLEEN